MEERQPLDHLHRGVDALVLVSVDAALDEERDLHVVSGLGEDVLGALADPRARSGGASASSSSRGAATSVERIDDDVELVSAESGFTKRSTVMRPPLAAAMLSSVHPIA